MTATPNHALQRTAPARHTGCSHHLRPPAALPQPVRRASAVAELGVVRRFLAFPVNESATTRTRLATLLITLLGFASLSCFLLYAFIHVSERSFYDTHGGMPLPQLTRFTLAFRLAILLLPVPWLALAVRLIARNNASAFGLTAFSSTLILALLSAAIFVIVTLAIPWLPIRIGFSPR